MYSPIEKKMAAVKMNENDLLPEDFVMCITISFPENIFYGI